MSPAAGQLAAATLAAVLVASPGAWAKGAVLRVCAGGHADFIIGPDPLAHGAVDVPRGTVFRFAGAELDLSPGRPVGRTESFERGMKANPALVTERAVRLTRAARCGGVPVAALVSPRFGWSREAVEGDGRLRFKPYGTVRKGRLSLVYEGADAAFRRAAVWGEIEARLDGATSRTVHLKRRELDVIERHRRQGHRR